MVNNALIFGATGSIGSYIYESFINDNIISIGTTSSCNKINQNLIYVDNNNLENLKDVSNINIIVWAHGYNFNDNIDNYDYNNFNKMIEANISFILTLSARTI